MTTLFRIFTFIGIPLLVFFTQSTNAARDVGKLRIKNPARYQELVAIQNHLDEVARNLALSTQNPDVLKKILQVNAVEPATVLPANSMDDKKQERKVTVIPLEGVLNTLPEEPRLSALSTGENSVQSLSEQITTYAHLPEISNLIQLTIAAPKTLSHLGVQGKSDATVLVAVQSVLNQPLHAFNQKGQKVAFNENKLSGGELALGIHLDEPRMMQTFVNTFNDEGEQLASPPKDFSTRESLAPQEFVGSNCAKNFAGQHDFIDTIYFKDVKEIFSSIPFIGNNAEIFALISGVVFKDQHYYDINEQVYMIELPEVDKDNTVYAPKGYWDKSTERVFERPPVLVNWHCISKSKELNQPYTSSLQAADDIEPAVAPLAVFAWMGFAAILGNYYKDAVEWAKAYWSGKTDPRVNEPLERLGAVVQFYEYDWDESEIRQVKLRDSLKKTIEANNESKLENYTRKGLNLVMNVVMDKTEKMIIGEGSDLLDQYVDTPIRHDPYCFHLRAHNGGLWGDRGNARIEIARSYQARDIQKGAWCSYEKPDVAAQSSESDVIPLSQFDKPPGRGRGFVAEGSGFREKKLNEYARALAQRGGSNAAIKFPPTCMGEIAKLDEFTKYQQWEQMSLYIKGLSSQCAPSLETVIIGIKGQGRELKTGGKTIQVTGFMFPKIPYRANYFRISFLGSNFPSDKKDIYVKYFFKSKGKFIKEQLKEQLTTYNISIQNGLAFSIENLSKGRGGWLTDVEVFIPQQLLVEPEITVVGY
ncbi:MAG: hypothetical protein HY559_02940 [Gammaproteobacteria bacterium]|nr:hypothetical protein [Gammaproteobacteria bacterium]